MAVSVTAEPTPAIPPDILSADLARRLFEGSRNTRNLPYAVWAAMAAIFHANLIALLVVAVGVAVHFAITVVFRRVRVEFMDDPSARSPEDWKRRHTLLSLVAGACWGVSGAILMSMATDPARAMLYVVLLGLATGSANVRAAHRPSMLAYVLPMIGLPTVALAVHGDVAALTVAGGGMVYMLFLMMIARDHRRLLVEHATLSHANGDLARRLGSALDETTAALRDAERARAEAAQALGRLQVVIDNMSDGVMLFDRDMRWAIDNQKVRDLLALPGDVAHLGARSEDIQRFQIGRGDFGVIEDVEADIREWLDRRRNAPNLTYTRWTPAGRFIEYTSNRLPNGEIVATYRDITDLKHIQAEAEQARNRLEDAIRALPSGFSLHDDQARLVVYNDSYERFFGNTPGLLKRGALYEDLLREMQRRGQVRPEHRDRGEAWITEMGAHHRSSFGDREMATADNRWIRISKHPTRDGGVVTLVTDLTEAKARERDLARAQAEAEAALSTARTVIETMPIGAALVDADNRIRMSNPRLTELVEIPEAFGAEGRPYVDALRFIWDRGDFTDGISFDDRAAAFFARIRSEHDVHYERTMPSGRHVDFRFTALADGGFLGTYVDITGGKRQQEALTRARADAEAALSTARTIIEMMPVGAALIGGDRHVRLANQHFTEFLDLPAAHGEEGRPYVDTMRYIWDRGDFGAGDFDQSAAAFFARLREEGSLRYERQMPHSRRVDFSLTALPDGGFLGTYVDVTEARQREAELEQARDAAEAAGRDATSARTRLADAIEAMPNGFVLADANGRIVLANQRFQEYFAPIADIIVPGADMRETLVEAARRGAVSTGGRSVADWVEARMAMRANPGPPREMRQPSGRWLVIGERRTREGGYASIYTDISEIKRREAELEQARDEAEAANQAKSTFLATMSHEIRTPMNGVLGMMEILQRQGIDEEQQSTVDTMRESAQSLLRIIDDVLDFSKIEAGRLELESTAFSLSGVIEGAMAAVRPQAVEKSLPLSADIDPGSSDALEGDPVRVRQILLNLLGNAVKFTERGGVRVAASTAPLGDGRIRVSLSVTDSGIGMDDAQLARLFEPFAQADSSTTRRYGGTGLGLSIVRRLAQLMEGDVSVESKPDIGTTFRVTMVLRAAPADSPLRSIAPISSRARRRLPVEGAARVLVVDDHPVNLKVLVKQLEMLGIAAETAVDGVEALAMWRIGQYAAVLADIHMPRMDGYELAGTIRREEEAAPGNPRRTPLVAVTANAMRGEEERCLAAGMDAYLAKPVTFDRLRAALSRWLPIEAEDGDPTIAGATPAIDESTLRAWLGDDPAAVADLLQDFLRDARQAERDIGASLGAANLPALAATAHRLKGSALAVGAKRLADVAAGLERAGRMGDRAACQDGLGALARELRLLAGEIG